MLGSDIHRSTYTPLRQPGRRICALAFSRGRRIVASHCCTAKCLNHYSSTVFVHCNAVLQMSGGRAVPVKSSAAKEATARDGCFI
eukprot:857503-Amphidinium_carterae.1